MIAVWKENGKKEGWEIKGKGEENERVEAWKRR